MGEMPEEAMGQGRSDEDRAATLDELWLWGCVWVGMFVFVAGVRVIGLLFGWWE